MLNRKEYFKQYNNSEKGRQSQKRCYLKNKEKRRKSSREYYIKHKKQHYLCNRNYIKRNPWVATLGKVRSRCNNPKVFGYYRYGGRGIESLITSLEIKELWFRDKAYSMKCPSIDRINNDGNYEFSNCRFIEKSENVRRAVTKKHEDKRSVCRNIIEKDLKSKYKKFLVHIRDINNIACLHNYLFSNGKMKDIKKSFAKKGL